MAGLDKPQVGEYLIEGMECGALSFFAVGPVGQDLNKFRPSWEELSAQEKKEVFFQLISDLSSQLQAFHDAKHVHRDIKPDNIFRLNDGKFILGDFGIAESEEEANEGGLLVGTTIWMSPFLPFFNSISHRNLKQAEVFSLALVFCDFLSGKIPYQYFFDGKHYWVDTRVTVDGYWETLKEKYADFKPVLEVLQKATSGDFSEQYPSCAAFKDALIRAIARVEPALPKEKLWSSLSSEAQKNA